MPRKRHYTVSADTDFVTVGGVPVYRGLVELLAAPAVDACHLYLHVLISRWSREGDVANAHEQASKVMAIHRKLVPAVERLCTTVGDDAWLTPEGRLAHGVLDLCTRHVTPHRDPTDPHGNKVIGYLLAFDDALVCRIASSGFTSLVKADGDELNVASQATIELCKVAVGSRARAGRSEEKVCLRLSDDPTRKGRLGVELGRIDRWLKRLDMRYFVGAHELDLEGLGSLLSQVTNATSEIDRDGKVASLMKGRFAGVANGHIPSSVVNLPPYLGHVVDPDLPGLDKRVREGSHLVTAWLPELAPALREYCEAFARGAKGKELDRILRRHKTPRQLKGKSGRTRYSSLRDATWDQLPTEDGAVRAMRWLTYSDHRVQLVPPDATLQQRAALVYANDLALRKLEVLRTGRYVYHYKNPTPTADNFGDAVVHRSGPLDDGYMSEAIRFPWPAMHKVLDGPDGVSVVSAELELDDDGRPVPWEHLGVPLDVLDTCVERLRRSALCGSTTQPEDPTTEGPMVRALQIDRWVTTEDGECLQWEAAKHWSKDLQGICPSGLFYRWIISRPAPNPAVPEADVNLGWRADERDVRTRGADAKHPARRGATVREYLLVAWLAAALRSDLLDVFDHDLVVTGPALSGRVREVEARRRQLTADAKGARERAKKARLQAIGFELSAMEARAEKDEDRYRGYLAKRDECNQQAASLCAEADRLSLEAAQEVPLEADLPIRRLSQIAELLARSGTRTSEGLVPGAVAPVIRSMFTDWHLVPRSDGLDVACTARIPLADGSVILRRLTGTVPYARNGRRTAEDYRAQVMAQLLSGRTLDEVAASLPRSTSRAALYVQARQLLTDSGVATYRVQALLDHPHPDAVGAVWAAIAGSRPEAARWTAGFQAHMGATYQSGTWAKSACPTTKMTGILRVFAVVAQAPWGLGLYEIAAGADVPVDFVVRLVTPRQVEGQRAWPRFLEWVPGRQGIEVRAHACPHGDCEAPVGFRWATIPVFLPETAPIPGDIGGVLCPSCSRLPLAEFHDKHFPREWHTPVARVCDGGPTSLRERQLTKPVALGPVARVARRPKTLTLDELVQETDVSRFVVKAILAEGGVVPRRQRRGSRGIFLFDAKDARAALEVAFRPEGGWDRLAYAGSPLQVSGAARRAGVSVAELRAAGAAGDLAVHRTRNASMRFQRADVDAWRASRSADRPGTDDC